VKSGLDDDFGWMWLFVDEHPWRHAHDWLESWLRGGARALNDAFSLFTVQPNAWSSTNYTFTGRLHFAKPRDGEAREKHETHL
jgi:hypothetical protein